MREQNNAGISTDKPDPMPQEEEQLDQPSQRDQPPSTRQSYGPVHFFSRLSFFSLTLFSLRHSNPLPSNRHVYKCCASTLQKCERIRKVNAQRKASKRERRSQGHASRERVLAESLSVDVAATARDAARAPLRPHGPAAVPVGGTVLLIGHRLRRTAGHLHTVLTTQRVLYCYFTI